MFRNIISLTLLLMFATFFFIVPQLAYPAGDSFYVSPAGNDTNTGAFSSPWKTIQKAANTLQAGDTVYVRAGTYKEKIRPLNSGTASSYITYSVYNNEEAIIDGIDLLFEDQFDGLFFLEAKKFIKIEKFNIKNSKAAGILVDLSEGVIIENNKTYNTISSGIGAWASKNITIKNNEVQLACNDGNQECISVGAVDGFEVAYNHIFNGGPGTNGGEGICLKDGSSNGKAYKNHVHNINRPGIYVDAWDKHTYNIDVYQNIVHDNESTGFSIASEQGGLLENIRFYNNISYKNKWAGLNFSTCCIDNHPVSNVKVINNTFYNNGKDPWGGGILLENPQVTNVVIRNNISSQNLTFQMAVDPKVSQSNYTADHNLIDGFRGDPDEINGTDYVKGDPFFVNFQTPDFNIQQNSPAIDKGSATDAPMDDYAGKARPFGAGYDIGAYEYIHASSSSFSIIACDINGDNKKDVLLKDNSGIIKYTTNLTGWTQVNSSIEKSVACGDINGDGMDDIIGMNNNSSIYYTLDKGSNWQNIPGSLDKIFLADMNGDGKADLLGLNANNEIYYTTNLTIWTNIPGGLVYITTGDFNGDGKKDIIGLNSSNQAYYTTNLTDWINIPGSFTSLATGDFNGDGKNDVAGFASDGNVYYTLDLNSWVKI